MIAPMLGMGVIQTWPVWRSLAVFPTLVLLFTLLFLPFVKGGVIGACWSLGIIRDPRDKAA